VAIPEMVAPSEQDKSIRARVAQHLARGVGIGLALIVNAAWICLLGYWIWRLI
jgi:hypothetical protein